jgi:hypothetical protein
MAGGTDLVLWWPAVWPNAVLQPTTGAGTSVWEAVPGLTNTTVRLPVTAPQGFFRPPAVSPRSGAAGGPQGQPRPHSPAPAAASSGHSATPRRIPAA